jgi:hypothetical protein
MPQKLDSVLSQRQNDYGDAYKNFTDIGVIWGVLLNRDSIPPYQVALLMDALKTIRAFKNPHHEDSWVDKLGYITLGQEAASHES